MSFLDLSSEADTTDFSFCTEMLLPLWERIMGKFQNPNVQYLCGEGKRSFSLAPVF